MYITHIFNIHYHTYYTHIYLLMYCMLSYAMLAPTLDLKPHKDAKRTCDGSNGGTFEDKARVLS